jgi:hypothetical protein
MENEIFARCMGPAEYKPAEKHKSYAASGLLGCEKVYLRVHNDGGCRCTRNVSAYAKLYGVTFQRM